MMTKGFLLLACLCHVTMSMKISQGDDVVVSSDSPAIRAEVVAHVNTKASSWKAEHSPRFAGMTLAQAKRMMGTFLDVKSPFETKVFTEEETIALPDNFDARTQWGSTCPSVFDIRDQGDCGSCWTFGTMEAATDRLCINGGDKTNPRLSSELILACCNGMTCMGCQGCDGGSVYEPWSYMAHHGVVSGYLYGWTNTCMPYTLQPCSHHVQGPPAPCPSQESPTPKCSKQCSSAYGKSFSADLHYGQAPYSISSVNDIMQELVQHGPVTAAFSVYEDFLAYKSGVYQHTTGDMLGGHAVKILGYGVDGTTPYWLVANSWNTNWGDNGFFKILRGSNECGIEDSIVAGLPKTASSN